jgi:hypothetical protein
VTFLVDVVFEFVGRTVVWLGAVALLAAVGLAVVLPLLRWSGRAAPITTLAWAALGGALLGASLVYRFELPAALDVEIWQRSVPVVWSIGGAAVVAAVWSVAATRRSAQEQAAAGEALRAEASLLDRNREEQPRGEGETG